MWFVGVFGLSGFWRRPWNIDSHFTVSLSADVWRARESDDFPDEGRKWQCHAGRPMCYVVDIVVLGHLTVANVSSDYSPWKPEKKSGYLKLVTRKSGQMTKVAEICILCFCGCDYWYCIVRNIISFLCVFFLLFHFFIFTVFSLHFLKHRHKPYNHGCFVMKSLLCSAGNRVAAELLIVHWTPRQNNSSEARRWWPNVATHGKQSSLQWRYSDITLLQLVVLISQLLNFANWALRTTVWQDDSPCLCDCSLSHNGAGSWRHCCGVRHSDEGLLVCYCYCYYVTFPGCAVLLKWQASVTAEWEVMDRIDVAPH